MSVCYAGNNASIMQIYDCTVVSYIMVLQKQISKICTPFLIDFICRKVLLYFVFKYFMWFTMLIVRLLRADYRFHPKYWIHILVDSCCAVWEAFAFQIYLHTTISIYTMVFMINIWDFWQSFLAHGIVIRLPMFSVVVISIWTDIKAPQKPTQAKFIMMLFDKSISL